MQNATGFVVEHELHQDYHPVMLASLLPGLRDIRTPLATGYLWILGLWLLFHDHVPKTEGEAHGIIRSLFQLGALLGGGAGLAAVSFVAYLLGCILAFRPRLVPSTRFERQTYRPIVIMRIASRVQSFLKEAPVRIAGAYMRQEFSAAMWGYFVSRKFEFEAEYGLDTTDLETVLGGRVDARDAGDGNRAYVSQITREIPAIAIRLQAKNRDLWDSFDRHQAEADFRFGIISPLLLIIGVFIAESVWWLGLLLIPASLFVLARREAFAASLILVQAIKLKIVDPPLIEQLKEFGEKKAHKTSRESAKEPPAEGVG